MEFQENEESSSPTTKSFQYTRNEMFAIRDILPDNLEHPSFPSSFIQEMREIRRKKDPINREPPIRELQSRRPPPGFRKPNWRSEKDPWDMPNSQTKDIDFFLKGETLRDKEENTQKNQEITEPREIITKEIPNSENVNIDKFFDFHANVNYLINENENDALSNSEEEQELSRGFKRWFSLKDSNEDENKSEKQPLSQTNQKLEQSSYNHQEQSTLKENSFSASENQTKEGPPLLEMLFQNAKEQPLPSMPQFSKIPLTETELLERQKQVKSNIPTHSSTEIPKFSPLAPPSTLSAPNFTPLSPVDEIGNNRLPSGGQFFQMAQPSMNPPFYDFNYPTYSSSSQSPYHSSVINSLLSQQKNHNGSLNQANTNFDQWFEDQSITLPPMPKEKLVSLEEVEKVMTSK